MGLDMYLLGVEGVRYKDQENLNEKFPLTSRTYRLGYWRKHPDLHGYIVENFAEGVDECQVIELYVDNLKQILAASEADELPHTEGFFFGASSNEDKEETREILKGAIEWAEDEHATGWRFIQYQASW